MSAFILEVAWSEPELPSRVGPFATRDEAEAWATARIVSGEWNVAPLTPPIEIPADRDAASLA